MHVAVWSGPRNLSTALMYSFGARSDFTVLDEPFYGAYLKLTGLDHPMGDQIMDSMECDPEQVPGSFQPQSTPFVYSKQMTHHMINGVPRDWFDTARHVFLVRHPARVVASYALKRERPTLDDLGFRQQAEIFEQIKETGGNPIVIDSFDIRFDPETALRKLCTCLELDWDPAMLSWPSGGHASDGVWAAHWYGAVHKSTGFSGAEGPIPQIEASQQCLVSKALPYYDALSKFALGRS